MKTHKDFEYDLFMIITKYYVRIKRTQEVVEVSLEVFRVLRNEAMKVYRYSLGVPHYHLVEGKWRKVGYTNLVLLDGEIENKVMHDGLTQHVFFKLEMKKFVSLLTEHQLDVFIHCMIYQIPVRGYARVNGLHKSSIDETVLAIRKKYKNFIQEPRHL